ncbi:ribonuclease E [Rodentibacter pneumotropicus]|uniref:Ribonuclease E n=1 Tax=Rodentibacter pneumotropicus TaxID=758 RepID=A0A3S4U842_9PAST|nr:ribonuclease E [Rodentibacter pneumotropicus]
MANENPAESAVNSTPVSDNKGDKVEQPAQQRRQRRELQKRVRIDDNAVNANVAHAPVATKVEIVEETLEKVPTEIIQTVEVEEKQNRQDRQRRTPRHLRVSNNQRRRRQEPKSPMPLSFAVFSPELASGKVWVDYSALNVAKENNFLSVDELLEQEKTKKGFITPATGIMVENSSVEVKPALDFITQPANESVQKKVQESLARLDAENVQNETISNETTEVENSAKFDRTYEFSGRLGTVSSVIHTKAEITLAKASEETAESFPIVEWMESRYYFYGKGAAGHHSAISHVYSEPTHAKS